MAKRFQQAFWRRVAGGDLVQLFDLMPDVSFFAKDRRGRFTAINRLGCEFCGVTRESDALGKTDFDFFPRRRAAEYTRDDAAVMRAGRPVVNRIESAPAKEGSPHMVLTTKLPLRDRSGRVIGIAGFSRRLEQLRERPVEAAPLAAVVERMHARFAENLTSDELANVMGVSVSHFDRTFRRAFETSPRQYLIRIRIEAACRRLAETTESLAAIALGCGFHDHAHFTRSFRNVMGTTPSAYRAAHKSPAAAAPR